MCRPIYYILKLSLAYNVSIRGITEIKKVDNLLRAECNIKTENDSPEKFTTKKLGLVDGRMYAFPPFGKRHGEISIIHFFRVEYSDLRDFYRSFVFLHYSLLKYIKKKDQIDTKKNLNYINKILYMTCLRFIGHFLG